MDFKDRLTELRRARGLSQPDVAERCGVSADTYRRWEWGKQEPRLGELRAVAAALGVSVADLIGEAPDRITLRHGALSLDIPATPEGLALLEQKLSEFAAKEKFLKPSSRAAG
ncbi:MAG: helix-turn-helix transcriptional regulator [Oscillospiraceae bacterium]|nr:helix-turn-helix transcriptional regulator [Oscillospiraceae bacterium]